MLHLLLPYLEYTARVSGVNTKKRRCTERELEKKDLPLSGENGTP
jgi:hypothetical protein